MKKTLGLLLATSSIFSMQLSQYDASNKRAFNHLRVPEHSVFVPKKLGGIDLYHDDAGFHIVKDDKVLPIQKCFIDSPIRNMTKKQLHNYQRYSYFALNQMKEGEYTLKAKHRLQGAGPILGTFMYWLTKTLCYTTAIAGTGVIVGATGGSAAGLVMATNGLVAGSGIAIGGAIVSTTATTAIVTTAGVVTGTAAVGVGIAGTSAVAGAMVGGVAAGKAALVTAGVVTSAGGIGATIAGVEAVSVGVGTFFGMLPTP